MAVIPSAPARRNRPLAAAASVLVAPLLLFTGCSTGGEEDRPTCENPIEQSLWVVAAVARPQFADLPVTTDDAGTIDARLNLANDCTYELDNRTGGRISASEYALESDGELSLLVPTTERSLIYRGTFGLEGETGNMFLTDRVGSGIGLYLGVPRVVGDAIARADLAGSFHVFALQLVLDGDATTPTPDDVGRALGGTLVLAADGSVSGTVTESQGGTTLTSIGTGGIVPAADGRFDFRFSVSSGAIVPYEVAGLAGGGPDLIIGADVAGNTATNDGLGLVVIMRERDDTDYDRAGLYGTYQLGMWTAFVNPSAPGTDTALGTLALEDDGSFRLEAQSNTGADFVYAGSWTAEPDGKLTFSVDGTVETWRGAFDQGYDTIVFVDPTKENRGANRQIELNLGMAIRPVPPPAN